MRNDDWTSGGSELNGGVDGHSYFSRVDCTPLHGKGISVGGTPRHTTTKVVYTSNEFLKKKESVELLKAPRRSCRGII